MMKSILALLFCFIFGLQGLLSQNVYEIYINAFSEGRELKNVQYTLMLNDKVVVEQVTKNGQFQFIIMDKDGLYTLKATKENYVPKVIHFHGIEYPFTEEYEIQEIDIEFKSVDESDAQIQIGELKWSNLTETFTVMKLDSMIEYTKQQYATSEKTLGEIYILAIETGDELLANKELRTARRSFEIALLSKPEDEYAEHKLIEIDIMLTEEKETVKDVKVFESKELTAKINEGKLDEIPEGELDPNSMYTVQLGAFSQQFDMNKFKDVPDFKSIKYDDYTRCFSGDFIQPAEAIQRKNDLVGKGYKDAWIVIMKGNERIGF